MAFVRPRTQCGGGGPCEAWWRGRGRRLISFGESKARSRRPHHRAARVPSRTCVGRMNSAIDTFVQRPQPIDDAGWRGISLSDDVLQLLTGLRRVDHEARFLCVSDESGSAKVSASACRIATTRSAGTPGGINSGRPSANGANAACSSSLSSGAVTRSETNGTAAHAGTGRGPYCRIALAKWSGSQRGRVEVMAL